MHFNKVPQSIPIWPWSRALSHLFDIFGNFLSYDYGSEGVVSAWPISCNSPSPLTIPCDSHLDLNTECTSSGGISHFMGSMSFRMIPPNLPHPNRIAAGVVIIAPF